MDFSLPLRSVVPTLDAEALSVLAGTESPLTGNKIASLAARGSRAGLMLVLDRLVAQGIVLAEPAGKAVLYRLNRDHLMAPSILAMAGARTELIARLRSAIEAWQVPPVHASLFGSVARHDAGPHSDVDVLVVRPDDVAADNAAWERQLRDLEEDVSRWTGNTLAWFETTREDLGRAVQAEEPVVDSWRQDALALAGQGLRPLLLGVSR